MTKEQKAAVATLKAQEKSQRETRDYFDKLDKIKADNEFKKDARRTAVQMARNHNLTAHQMVSEAEVVYQWLIKVLK